MVTLIKINQIKNNLLDLFIKSVTLLFIYRCKKTFNIDKTKETFDYSNLTDEERYVFYGNREREHRISIVLNTLFEGKPKTLEKIVSSINEKCIILRFLDSMEQFVGVNMNKNMDHLKKMMLQFYLSRMLGQLLKIIKL